MDTFTETLVNPCMDHHCLLDDVHPIVGLFLWYVVTTLLFLQQQRISLYNNPAIFRVGRRMTYAPSLLSGEYQTAKVEEKKKTNSRPETRAYLLIKKSTTKASL